MALKDIKNDPMLSSGLHGPGNPWKTKTDESEGGSMLMQRPKPRKGHVRFEDDVLASGGKNTNVTNDNPSSANRTNRNSPKGCAASKTCFFSDLREDSENEQLACAEAPLTRTKYFNTPVLAKGRVRKALSPVMEMDTAQETEDARRQEATAVTRTPPDAPLYRHSFAAECQEIVKQIKGLENDSPSPNKRKAEELEVSYIDAEPPPYECTPMKSFLAWEVSNMLSSLESSAVNTSMSPFGESLLDLERSDLQLQDFQLSIVSNRAGEGQSMKRQKMAPLCFDEADALRSEPTSKCGTAAAPGQNVTPLRGQVLQTVERGVSIITGGLKSNEPNIMNVGRALFEPSCSGHPSTCANTTLEMDEPANTTHDIDLAHQPLAALNTTEVIELSPHSVCNITQEMAVVNEEDGMANVTIEIKDVPHVSPGVPQHAAAGLNETTTAASSTWVMEDEPPTCLATVHDVASLNAKPSHNATHEMLPLCAANTTQDITSNYDDGVTNAAQVIDVVALYSPNATGEILSVHKSRSPANATQEIKSVPEVSANATQEIKLVPEVSANATQEIKLVPDGSANATQEIKLVPEGSANATQEIKPVPEVSANATQEIKPVPDGSANATQEIKPVAEVSANATQEIKPITEVSANATQEIKPVPDGSANATQEIKPVPEGSANATQDIVMAPSEASEQDSNTAVTVPHMGDLVPVCEVPHTQDPVPCVQDPKPMCEVPHVQDPEAMCEVPHVQDPEAMCEVPMCDMPHAQDLVPVCDMPSAEEQTTVREQTENADQDALAGLSAHSKPHSPDTASEKEEKNTKDFAFVSPSASPQEFCPRTQEEENVHDVSVFSVGSLSFVTSTPVPGLTSFQFQKDCKNPDQQDPNVSLGSVESAQVTARTDCTSTRSKPHGLALGGNQGQKPQSKGVPGLPTNAQRSAIPARMSSIPAARRSLATFNNAKGQSLAKDPPLSKIPPRGIPSKGAIKPPLARPSLPGPGVGNVKKSVEGKVGIVPPSKIAGSSCKTPKVAAAKICTSTNRGLTGSQNVTGEPKSPAAGIPTASSTGLPGRRTQLPTLGSQKKSVPVKSENMPVRRQLKPPSSAAQAAMRTQQMKTESSREPPNPPIPQSEADRSESCRHTETCEKCQKLVQENKDLRRQLDDLRQKQRIAH